MTYRSTREKGERSKEEILEMKNDDSSTLSNPVFIGVISFLLSVVAG